MTRGRSQTERDLAGRAFAEMDVARCYVHRPPYAPALYEFLWGLVPARGRALDMGCGPGKIAVRLADHFDDVVAVDRSEAMLTMARALDAGRHSNITWVEARVEDYNTDARFDLVTAGSSIHWLDHAVVFPKLAMWTPVVAVITGDEPDPPPCGDEAWKGFLIRWLAQMAKRTPGARHEYNPATAEVEARHHEAWMDVAGRERFTFAFRQTVGEFVESQHSRATWSRAAMGNTLATRFDRELEDLMLPFAKECPLELRMVSQLTWGTPRRTPRS